MLFEAKDGRWIVHQDIRVEHENAPLLLGLPAPNDCGPLRPYGVRHSAFTAASTASACPLTFTLRHSWRSTPLASIRKLLRSIPMYFLPYMLFSWMTSYSLQTVLSGSLRRSKGNPIFFLNFSCDSTESAEIPQISVFAFLK